MVLGLIRGDYNFVFRLAAAGGLLGILEKMLQRKDNIYLDICSRGSSGMTARDYAEKYGKILVVELLDGYRDNTGQNVQLKRNL